MKKPRSIRELLIVLRDNEKLFIDESGTGLCWLAFTLMQSRIITCVEWDVIKSFIDENCRKNKKYYYQNNPTYLPFYFPLCKWPPRKAWLNRWIKKLNK